MKTILILNGEILDYPTIRKWINVDDYILACDGGLKHCEKLGVIPNLILGDFDSVSHVLFEKYKELSIIEKYPCDKDFTDGELGVKKAIQLGNDVIIIGGISTKGRIDHVFSNAFMMKSFEETNINVKMVSEKSEIYLVTNKKKLSIETSKKFLSLIPLSEEVIVKTSYGLKYKLDNEKFSFGSSRSLSNEVIDKEVFINIEDGIALIICSCD